MVEKKKEKATTKSLQIYVGQDKMSVARTVNKQIEMLSMLTPEKYIMQRPGPGGIVLDYVETNYVIGRLNATFMFNWDAEIIQQIIDRDNNQIAVKVRLTVRFANEQEVKKDAWGGSSIKFSKDNKMMDLANDLKSAESDGIKKAASMIGICWDVYSGLASGKERQSKVKDVNGFTGHKQDEKKNIFRNIPIMIGKKKIMHTKYEVLDRFKVAKEKLGNDVYYKVLGSNGYEKSDEIPESDIQKLYDAMLVAFEEEKVVAKKTKKPEEEVEPEEIKEAEVVEEPSPKEKPAEEPEPEVVKEPEEQLGFTAKEVEEEQDEAVPEFQPAEKPEEKEKPEMPLQREKMSLTGLELQLVDKYNFTPDQICKQLKEMFGEDQVEKLTRKQTQEGIEFFKETIDLMEKKKAKEKFSK